jgi:hypothetical protein
MDVSRRIAEALAPKAAPDLPPPEAAKQARLRYERGGVPDTRSPRARSKLSLPAKSGRGRDPARKRWEGEGISKASFVLRGTLTRRAPRAPPSPACGREARCEPRKLAS